MKKEKTQPKSSAKPAATEPQSEDFFTAFLAKKKKAQTRKLEDIATLKASGATLNKEQQDKINREEEIRRQAEYFDEIRNLYFEAMSKHENDQSAWLTPDAKLRGLLALHLSHGKLPEADDKSAQLDDFYAQIFESHKIEPAFQAAKKFLENKELNEYLSKTMGHLKPAKEGKPHKESHKEPHAKPHESPKPAEPEHAKPHKEPAHEQDKKPHAEHAKEEKHDKPKSGKFLHDDEDEEHDRHHKQSGHEKKHVQQDKNKHAEAQPLNPEIVLLPEEKDNDNEEWLTSERQPRNFNQRRGYRGQPRGQGEGHRGRRYPRRGEEGEHPRQQRRPDQEEGEEKGQEGGEQQERRPYRASGRGRGDRPRRGNPNGDRDHNDDQKNTEYVQKA